jgi:predicted thioesterase
VVSKVEIGQVGRVERVVRPEHAADRFENTGVTVLATPVLCHWFESAAVRAIAQQLEPGEASVGTRIARFVVDLDRFLAAVEAKSSDVR